MPRTLTFVLFPGFVPLDLAGPLDAFALAGRMAPGHAPAYRPAFVAAKAGPVPGHSGLRLHAEAWDGREGTHTLVVPGCCDVDRTPQDHALLKLITSLAERAERVVSICTGAFLLAACGLLDGKRATTHWQFAADLARRHPAVKVEADAIFVHDGNVHTSAGVTAGIDLALALIEMDLGPAVALEVARTLVVYRRRVGNQSQFSAPLRAQCQAGARFSGLLRWIEARLGEHLTVERLAEQAGMSPRHFARVFRQHTGASPARYVELLRLDRARELIESGEGHMQSVAADAGFASDEQMRRAFHRCLGTTPGQYAAHFASLP